jgi:hypothetical protein
MLARNEDWIIGISARAALEWCDNLVIFDHASNDQTPTLLADLKAEYKDRVYLMSESNPVWEEMNFRNRMLTQAKVRAATHCAVVDADEILTANLLPEIRSVMAVSELQHSLEPPWVCIRGALNNYHTSGVWGTNHVSVGFKMASFWHWTARDGYDFHHRRPMGGPMVPLRPWKLEQGGMLHLQFVNERRLRAKQAAYKMQEVLRWPGRSTVDAINKMYNPAVYGTPGDTFAEVPKEWWAAYQRWMQYLDTSREPWQERQCKQWMAEHGTERFKGLDLFGVC